ncbi:hypothetical protein PPYR_15746 [Photinus pyralis]|uniref:Histone-lysine N-methyltransferase n=1 Tax=Photinus pyralis TaxID=7054 RepID=A0A5N3ZY24_PHOPY|nr:hypothetical protein PPYR_15746 [Photinus pyralis]
MELDEAEIDSSNKEKTFIDRILGEMKNQFNKTEKKAAPELMNLPGNNEVFTNGDVNSRCIIISTDLTPEGEPFEIISEQVLSPSKDELEENDKQIEPNNEDETESTKGDKDEQEDNDSEKPRIVLTFRKPAVEDNLKPKPKNVEGNAGTGRRTLRAKLQMVDDDKMILKRSARRRSRDCNESVLQSAIARKEKSYNEANKPQRLTRQLKPTPKILENLANAALKLEKTKCDRPKVSKSAEKHKIIDSDSEDLDENVQSESDVENEKIYKKVKHKHNRSPKHIAKRLKNEVSKDSDSDHSSELNESGIKYNCNTCDIKNRNSKTRASTEDSSSPCRRSHRLSSRNKDDLNANDDSGKSLEIIGDSCYLEDSDCQGTEAELIASRLCLCVQKTQLFISTVDDDVCGLFCTQGQFAQCEAKHQYHRECQLTVAGNDYCPHCGIATPDADVLITMHSSRKPIFLPLQKSHYPSAKMSFHYVKKEDTSDVKLSPNHSSDFVDVVPSKNSLTSEPCDMNILIDNIKNGDHEKLSAILGQQNLKLSTTFEEFQNGTALHYAAEIGNLTAVHLLVLAGADLDVFNKEQHTPIVCSILAFKHNVVKYLIKAGASLDLKGMDGMTALHLAAKAGNLPACKLLLESLPINLNFVNIPDDGGWTPLVWACEHGHFEIAKFLIHNSADPLLRDVEQNIALHWAAFSGSSDIAELLLNCKSDVNAVNAYGDTPLHIGARQNRYDCVLILLARGSRVHLLNKAGESALDCCHLGTECYNIVSLNVHLHSLTLSEDRPTRIILCNDITRGREKNPIQCVNKVDNEPKPSDFVYVSSNCITSDDIVIDRKVNTMHFCNCINKCSSFNCVCCNNSLQCWYNIEGKLVTNFNYLDPPMIFECNQLCSCNALTCNNRVVQYGVTQRFQLYKTESMGWGIRTICNIPKGTFVCEYIGEIITDVEADQREDDSYVFDLDSRDSESFCIDAGRYGNFARFINHSCDANLVPLRVFFEHQDLRFPHIAFFAIRDISAEEELSFDYGEKFWIVKYKSFTCKCGVPSCKYSKNVIATTVENYNKRLQDSV